MKEESKTALKILMEVMLQIMWEHNLDEDDFVDALFEQRTLDVYKIKDIIVQSIQDADDDAKYRDSKN